MPSLRVLDVVQHSPTLKSFYLDDQGGEPGQFFMVWLPGVDEKPLSVSGRRNGKMELSVKAVGPFTEAMMKVEVGQVLGLRGPYGNAFQLCENALILGGGCGIAPIRFLAQRFSEEGLPFHLKLAGKNHDDIFFIDDYLKGQSVSFCTEDGSAGDRGLITEGLDAFIREHKPEGLYASGPEPMLLALRAIASMHALPVQLCFERYMKCSVGICGQCSVDGSGILLCQQGPVLTEHDLDRISDLGKVHRDASGARPHNSLEIS